MPTTAHNSGAETAQFSAAVDTRLWTERDATGKMLGTSLCLCPGRELLKKPERGVAKPSDTYPC